jgi:TetR/AcrR family transcriptional repressor of nem operon
MPQPRAYDPDAFLADATRAFWSKGYAGASLADLVAATGVNRGSIYAAYPGKRALFLACLRHYDARYRAGYLAGLAARHSPRAAILAAFDAAAGMNGEAAGDNPPPGCLLVNTATEMGPHDAEISAFVAGCLAEVEEFFANRIRAGIADGSLRPALPVAETATALMGFFLALRVLARAGADIAGRRALLARARALLAEPSTPQPPKERHR